MFVTTLDLDTAPSLAAAFADHRTHLVLDVLSEDTPAPAGSETGATASDTPRDLDQDRFRRRHRLGRTGVLLVVGGTAASAVGFVTVIATVFSDSLAPAIVGVGLVVGGASVAVVGEVMIFAGGIGASEVLGENTTVGWVGVGLAIGGFATTLLSADAPGLQVAGTAASIGGLVCGSVELAQAGAAGRRENLISFRVVPTSNGLLVAGTF
jgi:hypothetical protein